MNSNPNRSEVRRLKKLYQEEGNMHRSKLLDTLAILKVSTTTTITSSSTKAFDPVEDVARDNVVAEVENQVDTRAGLSQKHNTFKNYIFPLSFSNLKL